MLAEIAAANAAFKIIQTAVQNGKEIYDCGTATQSYFDNKSAIAKRVSEKGQGDLEAFMALEKIKESEEILKETMIYAGRPNMYSDFLKFQSDARRERDRQEKLRIKKRADTIALFMAALLWGTGMLVLLPLALYIGFKIFGLI